jgi:mono/diheme cytochrome c family protein
MTTESQAQRIIQERPFLRLRDLRKTSLGKRLRQITQINASMTCLKCETTQFDVCSAQARCPVGRYLRIENENSSRRSSKCSAYYAVKRICLPVLGLLLCGNLLWAGDAQRGADVLRRENCLQCHNVQGVGGVTAPDLGRQIARRYTPAVMASVMWNHAPTMWARMSADGVPPPRLTVQDSDDLFAYFFSLRFFENLGEAERGKYVFVTKHCADCHSLREPSEGPGDAVTNWMSLGDATLLVQQMWNHQAAMEKAVTKKQKGWVELTGQELTDLSLYLRNLPQNQKAPADFSLPEPASGEEAFKATCSGCHKGSLALDKRLANMTLTDVAAEIWNHAPRMKAAPTTSPEDMRKIVAYIWERQYLGTSGNSAKGRHVFIAKSCSSCHAAGESGAPKLPAGGKSYTSVAMISVLWTHGPQMLERMKAKGVAWPNLSPGDVSNLVAYLDSNP